MRTINFTAKLELVSPNYSIRNARRGKTVYAFDLLKMPKINAEDYLFCRVRACSSDEPNRNGDAFPYDELKRAYPTFIGKGVYQDHNTNTVNDMRGIILDAAFIEADREHDGGKSWVELLIAVDKSYDDLCRKISKGLITDVSMGCSVKHGICSICENICKGETDAYGRITDMCDHIAYHKGELWDGKRVYEKCYDVEFLEISAVTDGADPQAVILDNNMRVSNDIPEHLYNVVAFPEKINGRKKVASIEDLNDELVYNLPNELSERLFNACKKADPTSYWNLFQNIQSKTFKEAKSYIINETKKRISEVDKELGE